jgi:hypothetical protein
MNHGEDINVKPFIISYGTKFFVSCTLASAGYGRGTAGLMDDAAHRAEDTLAIQPKAGSADLSR